MTSEYRLSQWAEIMRRRLESGLNIKVFCEREGLKTDRYHYWQRKLRDATAELMPIEAKKATVPAGWTQINTTVENSTPTGTVMAVEIGKCRVSVDNMTDMELLSKVCKALALIC